MFTYIRAASGVTKDLRSRLAQHRGVPSNCARESEDCTHHALYLPLTWLICDANVMGCQYMEISRIMRDDCRSVEV